MRRARRSEQRFEIALPPGFGFDATVRSHGWFDLLPFEYDRPARVFRFAALVEGEAVAIAISGREWEPLAVAFRGAARPAAVRAVVADVLRLDEDVAPLHRAVAADPGRAWIAERGAGRYLRAPTAFEDAVKILLTTNCSWALTRAMTASLVGALGRPAPDGRRAFPTPADLAARQADFYRTTVRTGYRAPALAALARAVAAGDLAIESWRRSPLPTPALKAEVQRLDGFGPYAAEGMLRLVGRYDYPALDRWARAEWRRLHPRSRGDDASILRRYKKFGSLAGLVLWLDLTRRWHV